MLFLVKKSLVKKKAGPIYCYDATISSSVAKVWSKVFKYFHAVAIKHHSSMRSECLACKDKFFVNNPLEEHALDFALHLSCLFGLCSFGLSVYRYNAECLSDLCQGLCYIFSVISEKNLVHTRSWIHHEIA
jgi:hypothetical protein